MLHCHTYRFLTEPLRLLAHWKMVDVQEVLDASNLIFRPIFEVSERQITDFWEIISEFSELAVKNQTTSKDDIKLYNTIRNRHDLLLNCVLVFYDKLASVDLETETVDLIMKNLKELETIHSRNTFFDSDEPTPVDLLLYDYYKTLERTHANFVSAEITRYIERLEAKDWMRSYNKIEKNYRRPFAPQIPSFAEKIEKAFEDKIAQISDFAVMSGMLFKKKIEAVDGSTQLVPIAIPFSLYPKKILREDFEKLVEIQDRWNILLNQMARDYDWYQEKLQGVIETDEFVRRSLEIKKKSLQYPKFQDKQVCIFRNDYMYHSEQNRWMQVEYNCIAVGLGPTSDKIQNFHKKIIGGYLGESIPDLPASGELICTALSEAFNLYNNPKAKVLFVVSSTETNVFDQRHLEYGLFERGITVIRKTLEQVYDEHIFDEETGKIYLNNDEIALVYYRTGYTPDDYKSERAWQAREILEFSQAIKCPSIDFFLINFKIFQLFFTTNEEDLKRFVKDAREREIIKSTFAEFYPIDTTEQLAKMIEEVRKRPGNYVLKPQLEGGGHNFYGKDVLSHLEKLSVSEAKGYLLMQKIDPNPTTGFMVRDGKLNTLQVNSELGVFGYVISDNEKVIKSGTGGTLLRSKSANVNEGGIMSGYGAIDSVFLQ